MDTGENLELVVETQAEEADRDLDKLIDRLGEVIEKLKKAKDASDRGLIPGLEDDMKNLMALRSQISKLNINKAGMTPNTKQWDNTERKIAAATKELEKFKARASESLTNVNVSATGDIVSKKIEDALKNQKIYGIDNKANTQTVEVPVKIKPRVKDPEKEARNKLVEDFFKYKPEEEFKSNLFDEGPKIDTQINIQSEKELAFAQKRITSLENTNKILTERIRAATEAGDKKSAEKASSKIRVNEKLISQYTDAIRRAEKAKKSMAEAGSVQISDVDDLNAAEKAAEKLRKAIDSYTASMRKFAAENDAAGVDRMKSKIDSAAAALYEYDTAIQEAGKVSKLRDEQNTNGIDTEINIKSVKDLAYAQKRLAALENMNKGLTARLRAAMESGDSAAVSKEASKIRQNEKLMSQYASAIERAEKAKKFMSEASSVQIIDVEDLDAAEKAAEKLRKSIESDTASMRKFAAANDASGVDRMRAKIDAAYASLNEYDKAIQGAGDVAKIRENQRALADLQKEMDKLQSKIAGRKSGNMPFTNNTATVRRLKIELTEAQMRAVGLKRALGDITVKEAAVTRTKLMAKYLAMNAVNTAKLSAESRRANRTFINMARALQLMAFRSTVRTVMRLTKEGIQNLAQYSKATDNAFNGSMSRMMSSVSQMKNAFATAMAPIIQMIEPYVVKVINLIIRGVNTVSMMLASLFGQKTFYKALPIAEDYASTLDKTTGKAKELKRQLMGFDELNVLNDPKSAAADAASGQPEPKDMFTIENVSDHMSEINDIKKKLEDLIPVATSVGGAILGWKLAPGIISGLSKMSSLADKVGMSFNVGKLLGWGTVISICVARFVDLYKHSKKFREGLKVIGQIGSSVFGGIGKLAGWLWGKIKKLGKAFVELLPESWKTGIYAFFDKVSEFTKRWDLDWKDLAITLAGIALMFIPGGKVFGAALLGFEGITVAIRGIGAELGSAIPEVDLFEGIGDDTKKKLEPVLTEFDDLGKKIKNIDWGNVKVTVGDADDIQSQLDTIVNQITNELDADKNEQLANLEPLKSIMDPNQYQEALKGINDYCKSKTDAVRSAEDEINKIMSDAAADNRALTDEESARITELMDGMKNTSIEIFSESQTEMNLIQQRLNDNSEAMSAEMCASLIADAAKARDETIASANEMYEERCLAAQRLLDEGSINEETYNDIIAAAEQARDDTINSAEEQYSGILKTGKENMGEYAKYIDEETGDMRTKWQYFCDEFARETSEGWATTKKEWSAGWAATKHDCSEAWDAISSGFESFKVTFKTGWHNFWADIYNWFASKINSIISGFESGINWIIDGLNKLGEKAGNKSFKNPFNGEEVNLGFHFNRIHLKRIKSINLFENGGFPRVGEMFIANESGPEMVGRMGTKSAVANTTQIVEGIASGVSDANKELISVVYAVTQQVVQAIKDKDSSIYLDRDRVGQMVTTTQNQQDRMYGR